MSNPDNKLIILPGFSIKNKDWAYETSSQLRNFNSQVIEWEHWKTGKAEKKWIEKEVSRIKDAVGNSKVNILAKSIGTLIAMVLLKEIPNSIDKMILCGIPINDFEPGDEKYYEILKSLNLSQILIVQNENDNHGSLEKVSKLISSFNPKIKILSKPSDNHEYPYWKTFESSLKKIGSVIVT